MSRSWSHLDRNAQFLQNEAGQRDPEVPQAKESNQFYFRMKDHSGVNKDSGLIHFVVATPENVHDLTTSLQLLQGGEEVVCGRRLSGHRQTSRDERQYNRVLHYSVARQTTCSAQYRRGKAGECVPVTSTDSE
jgi:IS5 family transposase